jgi:hypothetical protein
MAQHHPSHQQSDNIEPAHSPISKKHFRVPLNITKSSHRQPEKSTPAKQTSKIHLNGKIFTEQKFFDKKYFNRILNKF